MSRGTNSICIFWVLYVLFEVVSQTHSTFVNKLEERWLIPDLDLFLIMVLCLICTKCYLFNKVCMHVKK